MRIEENIFVRSLKLTCIGLNKLQKFQVAYHKSCSLGKGGRQQFSVMGLSSAIRDVRFLKNTSASKFLKDTNYLIDALIHRKCLKQWFLCLKGALRLVGDRSS